MPKPQRSQRAVHPPEFRELLELSGKDVDVNKWLESADSVQFLLQNARAERMVLYASLPHVLIHGVLAPIAKLKKADLNALANDFVGTNADWCIEHAWGGDRSERVYLTSTLSREGCCAEGRRKAHLSAVVARTRPCFNRNQPKTHPCLGPPSRNGAKCVLPH